MLELSYGLWTKSELTEYPPRIIYTDFTLIATQVVDTCHQYKYWLRRREDSIRGSPNSVSFNGVNLGNSRRENENRQKPVMCNLILRFILFLF